MVEEKKDRRLSKSQIFDFVTHENWGAIKNFLWVLAFVGSVFAFFIFDIPKYFDSKNSTDIARDIPSAESAGIRSDEQKQIEKIKTPTQQSEKQNKVKADENKVLNSDLNPRKIMDSLYGHEDQTDRKYAALKYQGMKIPENGWEAVVSEKSSPSGLSGHNIDAVAEGVKLTVFSDTDLRHLAIKDKIKIAGEIGSISSRFNHPLRDGISVHNASISLIGRGELVSLCDFQEVESSNREYLETSLDEVHQESDRGSNRTSKLFNEKYKGKWVRITAKFEFGEVSNLSFDKRALFGSFRCLEYDILSFLLFDEAQIEFAQGLSKGDTITIDGQLDEFDADGYRLVNIEFPNRTMNLKTSRELSIAEGENTVDNSLSENDENIPARITPAKLYELFLNVDHWTSETDITNLYRGKKIPEPGWSGIVQTIPKKGVISGYQMEVSDEYSKAMFVISFADNPSQFVPGDKVIFIGTISTLYQTSPGKVWIIVKASMVKREP